MKIIGEAVHEAGHALVAHLYGFMLEQVSLRAVNYTITPGATPSRALQVFEQEIDDVGVREGFMHIRLVTLTKSLLTEMARMPKKTSQDAVQSRWDQIDEQYIKPNLMLRINTDFKAALQTYRPVLAVSLAGLAAEQVIRINPPKGQHVYQPGWAPSTYSLMDMLHPNIRQRDFSTHRAKKDLEDFCRYVGCPQYGSLLYDIVTGHNVSSLYNTPADVDWKFMALLVEESVIEAGLSRFLSHVEHKHVLHSLASSIVNKQSLSSTEVEDFFKKHGGSLTASIFRLIRGT